MRRSQNWITWLQAQKDLQAIQFQLQEADAATQYADKALADCKAESSHQSQLHEQEMHSTQTELASVRVALQEQMHAVEQQQADLLQSSQQLSGLEQQVASLTLAHTDLTKQLSNLTRQLTEASQQRTDLAQQLSDAQQAENQLQSIVDSLRQELADIEISKEALQLSADQLSSQLAAALAETDAAAQERAAIQSQHEDSRSLCDSLTAQVHQETRDSAAQAQAAQSKLVEQQQHSEHQLEKLGQQLVQAEEDASHHKAAAEQLQWVLNAAQAGSNQVKQKNDRLTQRLETQLEKHSAEMAQVNVEYAGAQSRAQQLLQELQAAQQSCQELLKQAADSEAMGSAMQVEISNLQSSLQDRDDLILDLDNQIKVHCPSLIIGPCLFISLVLSYRPHHITCADQALKLHLNAAAALVYATKKTKPWPAACALVTGSGMNHFQYEHAACPTQH